MTPAVIACMALIAAVAAPLPTQAFGCFPMSLEDGIAADFAARANDPQPYVVLRGTLEHGLDYRTDEDPFRFEARFEGRQLLPNGEGEPFQTTVIVDGQCINGDCGSLSAPGTEQHFLALFDDGGLRVEVFPCAAFPNVVSPETAAALARCLLGRCLAN